MTKIPFSGKNCLSCKLYLNCNDKKKSYKYSCSKFTSLNGKEKTDKNSKEKKVKTQILVKMDKKERRKRDKADEYDFENVIKEVLNDESRSPLPRDLRVDDRDLPQAPNFYTFVTDNRFLNITPYPFAKQLEIGTKLFSEACPRCSDNDYLENVPVRHRPERFLENVQLMNFGKCPKCKATKSELYCSGELDVPWELVGLAGQRCVAGDTLLATEYGPIPFSQIAALHTDEDMQEYRGPKIILENGYRTLPAIFYVTAAEPLYQLELTNGYKLKARGVHPVWTNFGFVHLNKLTKDHVVGCVGSKFDYLSMCPNTNTPPMVFKKGRDDEYLAAHVNWSNVKSLTKTEPEKTYDLMVPYYHRFLGNGVLCHNSGKSQSFAMFIAYQTHTYLKNPSPTKTFGLLPMTDLHGQFTALTWQKAKDLLWDPIYGYLSNSPFFQSLNEFLKQEGDRKSTELFQLKPTYARYRYKGLFSYPVGPDRNKMRGTTAFQGGIDEIGLFDVEENSTKVKMNAEEVYKSLRNSFQTIRPKYYKLLKKGRHDALLPPLMGCISSPLSKKDMIVRLKTRAETNKSMCSYHYATWEINPNITRKDLAEEFVEDPKKAMRDFGAVPPNSSLPYIEEMNQILPIVDSKIKNMANLYQATRLSKSGHSYLTGKINFKQAQDGNKRILALDMGSNDNSFALVCGYYDATLKRPIFDTLLELQPNKKNPINFTFVYEDIICEIIEQLNVQMVVTDRWQSKKILHDIEQEYGVEIEEYSVKYGDFIMLKNDIINGDITIPKPEMKADKIETVGEESYPGGFIGKPISHFVYQLLTVQDNIKEVTKGDGTTDDILRALVLAYTYLVDPDYRASLSGTTQTAIQLPRSPGAIMLYSQGDVGRTSVHNLGVMASRGGVMGRR